MAAKTRKYIIRSVLLLAFFLIAYKLSILAIHKLDLRPYLDRFSTKVNHQKTKKTFTKHCESCHKSQELAFKKLEWQFGSSYNDIYNTIKNGHVESGMPAFDSILSDKKIKQLTKFAINSFEGYADETFLFNKDNLPNKIITQDVTYRIDTFFCDKRILIPWSIKFIEDSKAIITERNGSLFWLKNKKLTSIKGLPEIFHSQQGGLLDVALHPNFGHNKQIYLTYTKAIKGGSTVAVLKGTVINDSLEQVTELFYAKPGLNKGNEFGSRLLFNEQNQLFITVGHRGNQTEWLLALDNDWGKIHRINDDGSIPEDNPFVDTEDANPSIYSIGHRNPQGIDIHPKTKTIWSTEHGPRGGDELNLIASGQNYGWPLVTHGINYGGTKISEFTSLPGIIDPTIYWTPSIAPSGIAFVNSNKYGKWQNNLLVTSLKYDYLEKLTIESDSVINKEPIAKGIGRIRDVSIGTDSLIYFTVEGLKDYQIRDGKPGCIYRIIPIEIN